MRHLAQWLGLKIESNFHHKALLLSEAELRLIFDNVSQNIWRLDGEHRVRRANAGAARALGRTTQDVVDASADRVKDRLDPNWRDHRIAALESNTPGYDVKGLSSAPGGVPIWTSTDVVPDQDGADEERSLISAKTVRDYRLARCVITARVTPSIACVEISSLARKAFTPARKATRRVSGSSSPVSMTQGA